MNPFWEKVEQKNAKLIPYAIVVLAAIIIYEVFFHIENHTLNFAVEIIDGIIIAIFVIDLIFLAIRAKSTAYFFKNYWLDILAVLPLGLMFRGIGFLFGGIQATRGVILGQDLLHEGLEARKEIALVAREEKIVEAATKAGRGTRIFARIARVLSKTRLFKHFVTVDSLAELNEKRGVVTRKAKRKWKRASTKLTTLTRLSSNLQRR
ncbi:hypothetical protein HYV86_07750 [Candidatus Woesearchaeota archaeon]|nr:hypothetical protein [Candidatus Woesearchaeota archaeon]